MSFSVFFYASLAPKEDSYKYESRTALHYKGRKGSCPRLPAHKGTKH